MITDVKYLINCVTTKLKHGTQGWSDNTYNYFHQPIYAQPGTIDELLQLKAQFE